LSDPPEAVFVRLDHRKNGKWRPVTGKLFDAGAAGRPDLIPPVQVLNSVGWRKTVRPGKGAQEKELVFPRGRAKIERIERRR
jgi:hypothetical protein